MVLTCFQIGVPFTGLVQSHSIMFGETFSLIGGLPFFFHKFVHV